MLCSSPNNKYLLSFSAGVTEIAFTVVSLVLTLFSQSDNSLRYLKDLTANVLQIGDKLKGETEQQNDMWCHFGTVIFKNLEKGLFFLSIRDIF